MSVVESGVILPLSGDGGDGAGGDSVFFRIAAVVARGLHPPITRQRKDYESGTLIESVESVRSPGDEDDQSTRSRQTQPGRTRKRRSPRRPRPPITEGLQAFGHEVMERTMAQSEAGRSPAERGMGIVVLVIVTL